MFIKKTIFVHKISDFKSKSRGISAAALKVSTKFDALSTYSGVFKNTPE